MSTVEEIQQAIAKLSANERNKLAQWVSKQDFSDEEETVDQEWLEVAKRRSGEIKSGKAETVSGDEVMQKILT